MAPTSNTLIMNDLEEVTMSADSTTNPPLSFSDFQFDSSLEEALDAMGFETPTPVQQQAIPIILDDQDIIACAQTGTGKTAAFVLPILNKLAVKPDRDSQDRYPDYCPYP